MAVGFGHSSESHSGTTGSTSAASFTWNHDTTGDRCIVVFVLAIANRATTGESVTVGGVSAAIPALTGGASNLADARDTATEPGTVRAYFLDNVTQGASTAIVVNRPNDAVVMYGAAASFTATRQCEVPNTGVVLQENGAIAEQNVNDGSPGTNSMRVAGAYTGANAAPTAGANSTLLQSIVLAATQAFSLVRETNAGQGSRPVGAVAASDDRAAVHIAVREIVVAASGVFPRRPERGLVMQRRR